MAVRKKTSKKPTRSRKAAPKKKRASPKAVKTKAKKTPSRKKPKKTQTVTRKKAPRKTTKKPKAAQVKTVTRKKAPRKTTPPDKFSQKAFPIVGIGASAGGLEAFEEFFANMDPESGMAFVVVTHQHPGHTSVLPELIGKCTSMEIVRATDGVQLEPNRVYINPPGKNLAIYNATLLLTESESSRGVSLPIDFFFRSLALDQKDRAICIILSGTGTDGTLGLREVKGESGMAMAQEPESSKFTGMPDSAIATRLVDYILPSAKMPEQLIKYVKGPFLSAVAAPQRKHIALHEWMLKIFLQLRMRTGHDFSMYKRNTIARRIERRMNVHNIKTPKAYLKYLKENPHESDLLFKELLIGVTGFFRDTEAFKTVKEKAIPKLLASQPEDSPVRVWVAGCASGEEAYSLAILMHEYMEDKRKHWNVQIFGTDLDAEAIEVARRGLYPVGIAADVEPGRLKKYFSKQDNYYQIRKDIRDMLVFAPQNVIQDPPFTKLDFITCRNLLIYLEPEIQKKVLSIFHYALNANGQLFLGNSESIGTLSSSFKTISKKWKLYERLPSRSPLPGPANLLIPKLDADLLREAPQVKGQGFIKEARFEDLANKVLLEDFVPPTVIVNEKGELFHIHGRTSPFLELPEGKPTNNILNMAREGLRLELGTALRKAHRLNETVRVREVAIRSERKIIKLGITIKKINEIEALKGLFQISFETLPEKAVPRTRKKDSSPKGRSGPVEELKRELQYTRENLQSTIEELETTNEELKSTNEELQSTNEELQSSNEEIETSKEEMQSLNEELQTTNVEFQTKIEDLERVNDDMQNLLNNTEIPTIFLDNKLTIRSFTPDVKNLFKIILSDIGRPLTDIVSNFKSHKFAKDCAGVLKTLAFKEVDIQANNGTWYQMRIMPYRTSGNVIDGLVVTFINITAIKEATSELHQMEQARYLATIIRDSNDGVTLQDEEGHIVSWNKGAIKMYGYEEAEALKMNVLKIIPEEYRQEMFVLRKKAFEGAPNPSIETKRVTKNGKLIRVYLTLTLVRDDQHRPKYIATTERDMSEFNIK